MYLCYVDDSGDPARGVTFSALLIAEVSWAGVLEKWLVARRDIQRQFGVDTKRELHASELFKGRGRYSDTSDGEPGFGSAQRAATGRIALTALARHPELVVVTIAMSERSKPKAYGEFITWLDRWAEQEDTYVLVFYDGQQGLEHPGITPTPEHRQELWESAVRDSAPYREVHRALPISSRRIIEDIIMQDSRYSQLIQAADLIAYGAYQRHVQDHPEIWGRDKKPVAAAILAYMKLRQHWLPGSENGIFWLG